MPPPLGEVLLPRAIGRVTQQWQLDSTENCRVVIQSYPREGRVHLASLTDRLVFEVTLQDLDRDWIPLSEVLARLERLENPEALVEEPSWVRAGARIRPKSIPTDYGAMEEPGALITGVAGTQVNLREIEDWDTTPVRLSISVRTVHLLNVLAQYLPWPIELPTWLHAGAVITQAHDGKDYSVVSVDPLVGSMVITPKEENRPTRFTLHRASQHWRPKDTLVEVLPPLNGTPIVGIRPRLSPQTGAFIPPVWLQAGGLIRMISNGTTYWVNRLDNTVGKARLQGISRPSANSTSMEVAGSCSEVLYAVINREYEPLDDEGCPLSEYRCPECGETGKRDREREERRPDKIRAYRCSKHCWTFMADGSAEDGKRVPLTRFERDFEL